MPGPHFKKSDLDAQAKLADCDFQDEVRTPEEHDAKGLKLATTLIAQIDDQFGHPPNLGRNRQWENTVIVFTSDHGETLGDHGLVQGLPLLRRAGPPLIFSWPAHFEGNKQNEALVEMMDLSASFSSSQGLSYPIISRESLLHPLRRIGRASHREFVRCEYFDALDPHFTGGSGTYATMHRTNRYKIASTTARESANCSILKTIHGNTKTYGTILTIPA